LKEQPGFLGKTVPYRLFWVEKFCQDIASRLEKELAGWTHRLMGSDFDIDLNWKMSLALGAISAALIARLGC
jgi:hypothetical protein